MRQPKMRARPKNWSNTQELIGRLREREYTAGKAKTYMKEENGVYRNLTASGFGVKREELEKAFRKMMNEAKAHDREVVRRAHARWNV